MFDRFNITRPALSGLAFLLLVGGCCCKKECPGLRDVTVTFYNFSQDEIDTVWIKASAANTDFTVIKDSTVQRLPTFQTTWLPWKVDIETDYLITISNGWTYKITNLQTERTQCNDCFPYAPKDEFYQELSSYFVNGLPQFGSDFQIYK